MSKNRDTARMDMYFDMKQDQLNRKRNKIAEAQEKLKSEQAIVEEQMENVQQLQKSVDEQKVDKCYPVMDQKQSIFYSNTTFRMKSRFHIQPEINMYDSCVVQSIASASAE